MRRSWWSLHHHEAGLFEVSHEPISGDPSHGIIGVVHAAPPLEAKREGQRVDQVFRCNGAEWRIVSHAERLLRAIERIKNIKRRGRVLFCRSASLTMSRR